MRNVVGSMPITRSNCPFGVAAGTRATPPSRNGRSFLMSASEIDRITAFKNICPFIDERQQQDLAVALGIDQADLARRLEGLRNQDEFVLILHFLRSCRHLLPFEEGVPQLTETAAPDLLIQLHSGETLLVEVKSSREDIMRLGTGRVRKCMTVAADLGLPLYFALKQRGVWGLFSAEHVLAQAGKLRLVEDFTQSEFDSKFGNQWYGLPIGLEIHDVYESGGDGPVRSAHGSLARCDVRFEGKRILRTSPADPNIFAAFLLRAVNLRAQTNGSQAGRRRGRYTKVVHRLPFPLMMADYHFYLHLIHSTSREGGARYDRTSYLKALQDRDAPVTVSVVRSVIRLLESGGLSVLRIATCPSPLESNSQSPSPEQKPTSM